MLIFAFSPSFSRQILNDTLSDWKGLSTNTTSSNSTDIRQVSVFSDGISLNATLWLNAPFEEKPSRYTAYGILFDADSSSFTGLHGIDYVVKIEWNNNTWTRTFEEWSSTFETKVIKTTHNYTGFFEKGKKFVSTSVNLAAMGFPNKYKAIFYTEEKGKDYSIWNVDFTEPMHVPFSTISMSLSPRSLVIRPDEEKDTLLLINSSIPIVVHPYIDNISSPFSIRFPVENQYVSPPLHDSLPIVIKAAADARFSYYTIPVLVNSSLNERTFLFFPSKPFSNIMSYIARILNSSNFEATNKTIVNFLPLNVTVVPYQLSKTLDESKKNILNLWNQNKEFIAIASTLGALTGWILNRIKKKKEKL